MCCFTSGQAPREYKVICPLRPSQWAFCQSVLTASGSTPAHKARLQQLPKYLALKKLLILMDQSSQAGMQERNSSMKVACMCVAWILLLLNQSPARKTFCNLLPTLVSRFLGNWRENRRPGRRRRHRPGCHRHHPGGRKHVHYRVQGLIQVLGRHSGLHLSQSSQPAQTICTALGKVGKDYTNPFPQKNDAPPLIRRPSASRPSLLQRGPAWDATGSDWNQ